MGYSRRREINNYCLSNCQSNSGEQQGQDKNNTDTTLKLKTNEQHGPHQKPGVDSGAPEE